MVLSDDNASRSSQRHCQLSGGGIDSTSIKTGQWRRGRLTLGGVRGNIPFSKCPNFAVPLPRICWQRLTSSSRDSFLYMSFTTLARVRSADVLISREANYCKTLTDGIVCAACFRECSVSIAVGAQTAMVLLGTLCH